MSPERYIVECPECAHAIDVKDPRIEQLEKALREIATSPYQPPVVDDWRRQLELFHNIAVAALPPTPPISPDQSPAPPSNPDQQPKGR